jgi:hypothetical protein
MLTLIYLSQVEADGSWAQNVNIPLAPAYTIPGQTATTLADDEIETMQPSAHAVKSGWAKSWYEWNKYSKNQLTSWINSHQLWFPVWDSL